jgi:hypothetical protein
VVWGENPASAGFSFQQGTPMIDAAPPRRAGRIPNDDMAIAIAKVASLIDDVGEIKSSMREMTQAINKLAVIEERQSAANEAMSRAFKGIDALGARMTLLEQAQPLQKQSSDFVQSAVKYIVAAVLGAILAGFLRVPPAMPTGTPPALTGK